MSLIDNAKTSQFIRYGIVGAVNNSLLYLGYLLIVNLGINEKLSMTLMYLAGVVFGYAANYRWTFSQVNNRGAMLRYIFMHISGYLINLIILYVVVDWFGYPHQLVQIVAIIIIALFGFLMCKYFVFRKKAL